MRINPEDKICGIPITKVRNILKLAIAEDTVLTQNWIHLEELDHFLKLGKDIKKFEKEMLALKYFGKRGHQLYVTSDGLSFIHAHTPQELIPRKRGQALLEEFICRVEDVNTGKIPSIHKIPLVILFGSMLSNSELVGDVDIVVSHPIKEKKTLQEVWPEACLTVMAFDLIRHGKKVYDHPADISESHETWLKEYLNFSSYVSCHNLISFAFTYLSRGKEKVPYKIIVGDEAVMCQQYFEIIRVWYERGNLNSNLAFNLMSRCPFPDPLQESKSKENMDFLCKLIVNDRSVLDNLTKGLLK